MRLLLDELKALVQKERFSAHMPGHGYKALHQTNWYQLDTTEIDGADNLFAMQGILKQSTDEIARIYGAKQSRLLVNGSSSGLIASIMAVKKLGAKILVPRDAHKSVFNGIALANLTAIRVSPLYSNDGVSTGYNVDDFVKALTQDPEIKSVIITSPTYYGYLTDLKPLIAALKKRQGVLIVDEAHGAHLNFTSQVNYQALRQGADIVIQSAHKTLPALTQSAMLHFGSSIADAQIKEVDRYLEILQTSSPSYVLMASADMAVKHLFQNSSSCLATEQMLYNQAQSSAFKHLLPKRLPEDIFKWWLNAEHLGYTGYELSNYLKKCGIYCEFATTYGVLLYFSFNTTKQDMVYLAECIKRLTAKTAIRSEKYKPIKANKIKPTTKDTMMLPLESVKHRIIAEPVIVYPPGTLLVDDGDVINEDIFYQFITLRQNKHTVMGVSDQTLNTLKVYK